MKVAVTGAAGTVGRYTVQELLDRDYEVLAITHSNWGDCPAEQVSLDLRDQKQVNNIKDRLEKCMGIIHLAAIPGPRNHPGSVVLNTNMIGSYNIMMAAGEVGVNRLALASSDCTLGFTFSKNKPDPDYLPVDEKHPCRPDDSYGLSKVLMERTAEAMVQRFPGMSIASLRITGVITPEKYAPGTNFYKKIHNQEFSTNLWGYIDVRDCARAFRLAIENDLNGHEAFFIAARDTKSIIPTRKLIDKFYPEAEKCHDFKGYESLENSQKAEKILGFVPEYNWRDEVEKFKEEK